MEEHDLFLPGDSWTMTAKQISLAEANAFVIEHHRHHDAMWGHKFSIGAYISEKLVGVAICGRPVGRKLDDGKTLEVTRLCTDGTRNACSFLYSAAAREAKRRGYAKIITYILQSETGASLRASSWTLETAKCGKPSWDGPRYRERHKVEQMSLFPKKTPPPEYKQRWARTLKEG